MSSAVEAAVLQKYTNFGWLKGGNENWEPVKKGAVIVSESFYRRFGVKAGDRSPWRGRGARCPVKVAAVFYDYTSEHGVVMMDRSTYLRIFQRPHHQHPRGFRRFRQSPPERTSGRGRAKGESSGVSPFTPGTSSGAVSSRFSTAPSPSPGRCGSSPSSSPSSASPAP